MEGDPHNTDLCFMARSPPMCVVSGGSLDASRASCGLSDTASWRVDGGQGDTVNHELAKGSPLGDVVLYRGVLVGGGGWEDQHDQEWHIVNAQDERHRERVALPRSFAI